MRVTTYATDDYMPKTIFYSLKEQGDTVLNAYDELEVYDYYATHILEPVTIKGEVVNPISVNYEKGMSVADLLGIAGGLTKRAYNRNIEIVRYSVDENQTRQRKILKINTIKKSYREISLEPYDEVNIFKIPQWNEQKAVVLKGEIRFPGTYSIENGEKLESVIKRAGGFTKNAFTCGAVFTRERIKQNQVKQYNRNIAHVKRELALYNAMPANAKKPLATGTTNTLDTVVKEAEKYEPMGRVSIHLDRDLTRFAQSQYNVVLNDKDTLTVPGRIDTVTVFGEVFNPSSFVYNSELDTEDYIRMASGVSRLADEENIYVVHADGTSEPLSRGWVSKSVQIQKGDSIVVPIFIKEDNKLDVWDSVSKILASFAITAATLNTLGIL